MIIILIITVIIIILLTRLVWRSCSHGPAFVEYSFRAGSFGLLISSFASIKFHSLDKGYPDVLRYQFCSLFVIEAVDPPGFKNLEANLFDGKFYDNFIYILCQQAFANLRRFLPWV